MTTSVQRPGADPVTGRHRGPPAVDLAIGAAWAAWRLGVGTTRIAAPALRPVAHVVPTRWLTVLERSGADRRARLRAHLSTALDALVPGLLSEILRRAGLTEMLLRYVDLDAIVAAVDLDAAASRIDVDAIVRRADLDAAAARIDVDAVAARLDLDRVLRRVDVDGVARRLDLVAVLDRIDLTAVVLHRVDLKALADAVLAQVDLVALAEEVIDAVDLPEIIRESTGSMASDTVRGARMQGISADEAVGRAMDRLLLRHSPRSLRAPAPPPDRTT